MKREIAASLFFILLGGTSLAGEVQPSQLTQAAPDELTSLIRKSLTEQTPAEMRPPVSDYQYDWQLYSSELWVEGLPELPEQSLDAVARKTQQISPPPPPDRTLPTSVALNHGQWTLKGDAKVETPKAPVTVVPIAPYATAPDGGTGTLSGRVEYDLSAWQFYGGTNRNLVANPDGTLAPNQTILGGTYYRLPDTLYGGKIGTGFEVNPVGDAKTRLEYRQTFGTSTTEGFLAAERIVPFQQELAPDNSGSNVLKAGINRKF